MRLSTCDERYSLPIGCTAAYLTKTPPSLRPYWLRGLLPRQGSSQVAGGGAGGERGRPQVQPWACSPPSSLGAARDWSLRFVARLLGLELGLTRFGSLCPLLNKLLKYGFGGCFLFASDVGAGADNRKRNRKWP